MKLASLEDAVVHIDGWFTAGAGSPLAALGS
jgi:hypothetical protein